MAEISFKVDWLAPIKLILFILLLKETYGTLLFWVVLYFGVIQNLSITTTFKKKV